METNDLGFRNCSSRYVLSKITPDELRLMLEERNYNQSKLVRDLNIHPGTFRRVLKKYFGDEFVGTRKVCANE